MRVWIDCEFTDLEKPWLISIGLVSETGRERYIELREGEPGSWRREDCTEFVVARVLPLLSPDDALSVPEAARYLGGFLASAGASEPLEIYADYMTDIVLARSLLIAGGFDLDLGSWLLKPLSPVGERIAERALRSGRRHHALDDAKAYKSGFLAEEVGRKKR